MSGGNRRRQGVRGLVVGMLALLCVLASASAAEAELVFKRPHGSRIHFSGTPRVWCGPWSEDSARSSIHVQLRTKSGGWELSAVQHDLKLGRRIKFPNGFSFNNPHGAFLFAYVRHSLIEASTNEEEASGSMVFSKVSCELGGIVEFRVHAVLGSELLNGTRPRVSGSFRGQMGEPPTS